jgi:hypothetical protein
MTNLLSLLVVALAFASLRPLLDTPVLNSLRRYEKAVVIVLRNTQDSLFQSEQVDGGGENKIEAYRVFDLSIQHCLLLDDL